MEGVVKINFDGSCIDLSAARGFILRDWMGKVLKVGAANYGLSSCLVAKAWALKDGVLLAVQALQGKIQVPWKIANIITDIHGCFL